MLIESLPTLNEIEIRAVKIVSQSPRHLWQAGILTLINARGGRMLACYGEPVVVVWEFWKMTRSQQEALRSAGINRHEWERSPLGAHGVHCSCIERGRLVDCQHVQKYHDLLFNKFQRILVLVGCVIFQMRIILAIAEKQDGEGEPNIRKTPALRDAFAMRWWQHHTATSNTSNKA